LTKNTFHPQSKEEIQNACKDYCGVKEIGYFAHSQIAEGVIRPRKPLCLIDGEEYQE
jgi:hypothetical protein